MFLTLEQTRVDNGLAAQGGPRGVSRCFTGNFQREIECEVNQCPGPPNKQTWARERVVVEGKDGLSRKDNGDWGGQQWEEEECERRCRRKCNGLHENEK